MKYLIILIVACCAIVSASGQSLTMYKSFGSTTFEYQKDTNIYEVSPKQVAQILQEDPLAYAEFKKARTKNGISGVMGFAGVGLMVVPIITSIAGGDTQWSLAAGGAALIIASIPIHKSSRNQTQNAFDMYNKRHTAFKPRVEYFVSGVRAGVVIKF